MEITWEKVDSLEELGITAQTTGGGLVQNTRRGPRNLLFEQGQLTAVRGIDGVATVTDPSVLGVFFPSGSSLTYTWTLPGPTTVRPTLVTTRLPDLSVVNHYIPESQNAVVVRYTFGSSDYRIYVDGELLTSFPRVGYFLIPSFASSNSGLHTLEVSPLGASQPAGGTWHYNQKALRFTEDFPAYDLESEEPVQITNEFEWDNGAPVQGPTWVVRAGSFDKLGSGTTISATWDPKEWILSRVAESPEGHASGPSDIRAQSDQAGVTYEVRANAVAYPATAGDSILNYAVYSEISSTGQVPGKRAELRIIDAQVLPQPAFEEPGDTVTLTAQAVLIASEADPNDIEWTVDLLDEYGDVVVEEFASGTGPHISAEWDGTAAGQAVEHPASYQFKIRAEVDESPPVAFRSNGRGVLAQDGGNGTLKAEEKVPVSVSVEVLSVKFAGNEALEATDDGPYPVFDYINQNLYWGGGDSSPQWVRGIPFGAELLNEKHIPVVMKGGSTVYVGAKFQVRTSNTELDTVEVSAVGEFNGQSLTLGTKTVSKSEWNDPVVLALELPNTIGRHALTLDWEFNFGEHGAVTHPKYLSRSKTPTDDKSHRLYTVFGAQPSDYKNTSNVTGGAEIWYHPESMHDEVPVSEAGPPSRSPLDLATHWASGVDTGSGSHTEAVEKLANGYYEEGGYLYISSTKKYGWGTIFGAPELKLFDILKEDRAECSDGAALVKVFANFLGVPAKLLEIEDTSNWRLLFDRERGRRKIYSSYLRILGGSNGGLTEVFAPLSVVGSGNAFRNNRDLGGAELAPRTGIPPGVFLPADFSGHAWKQHLWENHAVTKIGDQLVDPSARFSQTSFAFDVNPDYYINQLNIIYKDLFSSNHQKWLGFAPAATVLANLLPDFKFVKVPTERPQSAMPFQDYMERLLYGSDVPLSMRRVHGYNDIGSYDTTERNKLGLMR